MQCLPGGQFSSEISLQKHGTESTSEILSLNNNNNIISLHYFEFPFPNISLLICYYFFLFKAINSSKAGSQLTADVASLMDTWTQQMGYPVITLQRSGNSVTATQERFLLYSKTKISEEFKSPFGQVFIYEYLGPLPQKVIWRTEKTRIRAYTVYIE